MEKKGDVATPEMMEVVGKLPALDVIRGWPTVDRCTELNAYDPSREHDAFLLSMWSGEFQKIWADHLTASGAPLVVASYEDHGRHESECHLDLARTVGFCGDIPEPDCVTDGGAPSVTGGGRNELLVDAANHERDWGGEERR